MKKVFELSHRQMRDVTGGGPEQAVRGMDSVKHCFIDGEVIFELICTDKSQCTSIYGAEADCY